ncbi:hypothetical protein BKA70DRAFT_1429623 [Coprinopsis sp. MPI-PUGE-AT-0042]|nr:hypothetical protein BKA70DRAFT_1429623 [Coprinopsis sp. MPI-PUGE-AT-0042]
MTLLDDNPCSLLYSSRRTVNFILELWKYKPSIDDKASDYLKGTLIPPATSLVTNCLVHYDGGLLFCEVVISSKRQLSSFLDMLLFKLQRLRDLLYITRKGGVLHQHSQSLSVIVFNDQKALVTLLLSLKNKTLLLSNSILLFCIARSMRNLDPILESGLLEALVNAFPSCDWKGEEEIEDGTFIIALLASAAGYPQVLGPLNKATAPLLEILELRTVHNRWYSLASFVEEKHLVNSSVTLDILPCDGDTCVVPTALARVPTFAASHVKTKTGNPRIALNELRCDKGPKRTTTPFDCPNIQKRFTSRSPPNSSMTPDSERPAA